MTNPLLNESAGSLEEIVKQRLSSLDNQIFALAAESGASEPHPPHPSIRARLSTAVKRRLYRLLWWQKHRLDSLVNLVADRVRAESALYAEIAAAIATNRRSIAECNATAFDLRSSIRMQAAEIRELTRLSTQAETELSQLNREMEQVREIVSRSAATLEEMRQELTQISQSQELTRIAQSLTSLKQHHSEALEAQAGFNAALSQQAEQLAQRLADLGILSHEAKLANRLQERRVSLLIEEVRKFVGKDGNLAAAEQVISEHVRHKYDSLYVAFEDVFRGERNEIKARQSAYLPLLRDKGIGTAEMPLLDVGCGRGEWIELLKDHGMTAVGIDNNELMIEYCRSVGLDVLQADALTHLKSVPSSSLGAVSSFHMVEHLPFEITLEFVDEALRVLKPGGVVILETPNCRNLLVASYTFHLDPTHLKPLPSPMLRFFVEARGFCDVRVLELNPNSSAIYFPDDGKGTMNRLNDLFFGPQDYAVIGVKP